MIISDQMKNAKSSKKTPAPKLQSKKRKKISPSTAFDDALKRATSDVKAAAEDQVRFTI